MIGRWWNWEGAARCRVLKSFDNDRRKPLSRGGRFFEEVFFVTQEGVDVEGKRLPANRAAYRIPSGGRLFAFKLIARVRPEGMKYLKVSVFQA